MSTSVIGYERGRGFDLALGGWMMEGGLWGFGCLEVGWGVG